MSAQEHNHPDPFDQASALEQAATDQAIYEVRRYCKPTQAPLKNGTYEVTDCDDCGNEIGAARLKVAIKNTLCVHCATLRERRAR